MKTNVIKTTISILIDIVIGLFFFSSCIIDPPLGYCSKEEISNLIDNDHFIFDKNGGTQIGTGDFWWIDYNIVVNGVSCYIIPDSTFSNTTTYFDSTRITGALYTSNDTLMHIPIPNSRAIMSYNLRGTNIDTIATSWFCISINYNNPTTLSITLEKNTTAECRYINMEVWAANCRRSINIEQEAGE